MRYKSKNFIIPCVIYPFNLMVSINESDDQFANSILKKYDAKILDDIQKQERINQNGLTYIYSSADLMVSIIKINNFQNDAIGKGTLAHEIFHATEFILRVCGFTLNNNSHEAYAYLLGYLTEQVYGKI